MPEMTLADPDTVRVVSIDGLTIDIIETDRYVMVELDCNDTVIQTGFPSRGKMMVRYANRLANLVTQEIVGGVGTEVTHLRKIICLVFKEDGSGLMEYAPVVYPQNDQEIESCKDKH